MDDEEENIPHILAPGHSPGCLIWACRSTWYNTVITRKQWIRKTTLYVCVFDAVTKQIVLPGTS